MPAIDYRFKRRSAVTRRVYLKDGDGAAINLTGATVEFLFSPDAEGTPVFDEPVSLSAEDAAAGIASFTLTAAQTNFTGPASGEFRITRGGLVEFVPGDRFITFQFYDGLEAEP